MKALIIIVLVFLGAVVLVGGYFGFVPGVSSLFGSDKPRDLGVTYTDATLTTATKKTGVETKVIQSANMPTESYQVSGQQPVDIKLSGEDLTALVAKGAKTWKYYPVSNVQVKFNNDGSAEVSGKLEMDKIDNYLIATGAVTESVQPMLDKIDFIPTNPVFYLKGRGSMKDHNATVTVERLEIGRFSVPANMVNDYLPTFLTFAEAQLKKQGVTVNVFEIVNGEAHLDAILPKIESYASQ